MNSLPVEFDASDRPLLERHKYVHNAVSVVEAGGRYDLDKRVNIGDRTDAFGLHTGFTEFNDSTTPSAKWWDGSDSGLSITNISDFDSSGKISFQIGVTPNFPIYYAGLEGITLSNPPQQQRSGGYVRIEYILQPGYEIESVQVNGQNITAYDTHSFFYMPAGYAYVVFFTKPSGGNVSYLTKPIYVEPGAKVLAYTKNGPVSVGLEKVTKQFDGDVLGYPCRWKSGVHCDVLSDYTFNIRAFRVETSEGYELINVRTNDYSNFGGAPGGIITQSTPLYSVPYDSATIRKVKGYLVQAQQTPDYFCQGNVLEWDNRNIDADNSNNYVYKRIGTVVSGMEMLFIKTS